MSRKTYSVYDGSRLVLENASSNTVTLWTGVEKESVEDYAITGAIVDGRFKFKMNGFPGLSEVDQMFIKKYDGAGRGLEMWKELTHLNKKYGKRR